MNARLGRCLVWGFLGALLLIVLVISMGCSLPSFKRLELKQFGPIPKTNTVVVEDARFEDGDEKTAALFKVAFQYELLKEGFEVGGIPDPDALYARAYLVYKPGIFGITFFLMTAKIRVYAKEPTRLVIEITDEVNYYNFFDPDGIKGSMAKRLGCRTGEALAEKLKEAYGKDLR